MNRPVYSKDDVQQAAEAVRDGKVILYPTDTIWGLGCDASNPQALEKLMKIKQRDPSKGFIILIDQDSKLHRYVKDVPEVAWDLLDVATDPLTIVFDNGINLAPLVKADDGSIAIRVCKDDFCKELLSKLKAPLVSTSANISGEPSPENFSQVNPQIINSVDYAVKHRQQEKAKGKASSIIKLGSGGEVKVLRT
jgi:L-threonylcarbamoyladenylate synthase